MTRKLRLMKIWHRHNCIERKRKEEEEEGEQNKTTTTTTANTESFKFMKL